jgi:hypothetical protein
LEYPPKSFYLCSKIEPLKKSVMKKQKVLWKENMLWQNLAKFSLMVLAFVLASFCKKKERIGAVLKDDYLGWQKSSSEIQGFSAEGEFYIAEPSLVDWQSTRTANAGIKVRYLDSKGEMHLTDAVIKTNVAIVLGSVDVVRIMGVENLATKQRIDAKSYTGQIFGGKAQQDEHALDVKILHVRPGILSRDMAQTRLGYSVIGLSDMARHAGVLAVDKRVQEPVLVYYKDAQDKKHIECAWVQGSGVYLYPSLPFDAVLEKIVAANYVVNISRAEQTTEPIGTSIATKELSYAQNAQGILIKNVAEILSSCSIGDSARLQYLNKGVLYSATALVQNDGLFVTPPSDIKGAKLLLIHACDRSMSLAPTNGYLFAKN